MNSRVGRGLRSSGSSSVFHTHPTTASSEHFWDRIDPFSHKKRAKSCRNQPKETKPREDQALPQPEKLFLHLWCSLVSAVRCTFRVFPCPTCFWGGFVTLFASSFSVWGEGEMEKGILFQNPEFGQLCLKMEVSIKPISEGLKEEIF